MLRRWKEYFEELLNEENEREQTDGVEIGTTRRVTREFKSLASSSPSVGRPCTLCVISEILN